MRLVLLSTPIARTSPETASSSGNRRREPALSSDRQAWEEDDALQAGPAWQWLGAPPLFFLGERLRVGWPIGTAVAAA